MKNVLHGEMGGLLQQHARLLLVTLLTSFVISACGVYPSDLGAPAADPPGITAPRSAEEFGVSPYSHATLYANTIEIVYVRNEKEVLPSPISSKPQNEMLSGISNRATVAHQGAICITKAVQRTAPTSVTKSSSPKTPLMYSSTSAERNPGAG